MSAESYAAAKLARRWVPRPLRYCGFRLLALLQSIKEARTGLADEGILLPPPLLRYRVHGSLNPQTFLTVGRQSVDDLTKALNSIGKGFDSFDTVLDFGCGCGRTLRYLSRLPETSRVYGTDIDNEAIAWCRSNIPFGRFSANNPAPPLPFPAASFDLIYGISVFTHLDENYQFDWLKELKRVAKPGGILVLTAQGSRAQEIAAHQGYLSSTELNELRVTGFLFKSFATGKFKTDGLPDFYQVTFHSKPYVNEVWARFFTIRNYIEHGCNGYQDVVLLSNN